MEKTEINTDIIKNEEFEKLEKDCNALLFGDLCSRLENMDNIEKTADKIGFLFPSKYKEFYRGKSCFPLLRLLVPDFNKGFRENFKLKQLSLSRTYVDVLGFHEQSYEYKSLVNHTNKVAHDEKDSWCDTLQNILRSRVNNKSSTFTIGEVNIFLDDLSKSSGDKEKGDLFRNRIINRMNASEQKWLAKIIFKDLSIGLKADTVLKSRQLFPSEFNALDRYNAKSDMREI